MAFRIRNMEMMLMSGIPLAKFDSMRPTLERHGKQKLTSSTNMRQLRPPMLQRELDCIMAECLVRDVVILFDGTSESSLKLFQRKNLTPFHVFLQLKSARYSRLSFGSSRMTSISLRELKQLQVYERSFNHENLVDAIIELTAKFKLDRGGKSPRNERLNGQYNRTVRPGNVLSK